MSLIIRGIIRVKPQSDITSHHSEWLSSIKQQVLVRMWRKGNPFALLVGMQTDAATVENSMEIPQKIKNDLPKSDPTSVNISKEIQNRKLKEHKHPSVHCSVIYNCQDLDATPVSISR